MKINKLLKKYLLTKWWLPLSLFGLCTFLFLSDLIFPNTYFGFYLLSLSGIILFIASIWQLCKGKKIIGFLQLSMLTVPVLFLALMAYFFIGMIDKSDGAVALDKVDLLIKEKTDLSIPDEIEILENLVEHTDGAFDSDYSIVLKIKYQESEEKLITDQIHNSIVLQPKNGIWKRHANGFDFKPYKNQINKAEPFYSKVDTLLNIIELDLIHL